jgi:hypothetical protein
MSKIDEIKRAYETYRRERKTYADTCRAFAEDLRSGLAEYLECPVNEVKFFKPSMHRSTDTFVNVKPDYALELQKDGYWRFGLAFKVAEVGSFLYEIRLKHVDSLFVLRLGDDVDFEAHAGSRDELKPFFDHMISVTTGYYETFQQEMLSGEWPERVFELLKSKS